MSPHARAREWLAARTAGAPPTLAARMAAALGGAAGEALAAPPLEVAAPAPLPAEVPAPAAAADVPDALAEAALRLLERVVAGEGGAGSKAARRGGGSLAGPRESALDLLAADALLTGAFEAAAERSEDEVEALAARYGARRLALLLPGAGGS